MMRTEIAGEFPDHRSDHSSIVKGKRTKRLRPSTSSSADDSHNSSPEPSSGISTCTKEDEDMANCLILLARGDTPPPQIKTSPPAAVAGGVYVYECKTCNRAFQSFQALGGHRASHKRPKPDQEAAEENSNSKLSCSVTPPPPKSPGIDKIKANKIHGCSICGAEFASGQALGGHMRRHRALPVAEKPLALDLDLNLPAPPEADDNYNQQPRMVFSAAALVDCHY